MQTQIVDSGQKKIPTATKLVFGDYSVDILKERKTIFPNKYIFKNNENSMHTYVTVFNTTN